MSITHSYSLDVPPRYWEATKGTLRKIRELVRDEGGHSRLTKKGNRVTLTVTADTVVVLDVMAAVKKMADSITKAREAMRDGLLDMMTNAEQQRRKNAADSMAQALFEMEKKPK